MPGLTCRARPGIPRVMVDTRKIGLFGGTFDPVHRGHLHLADRARQELALDEVRFLPCRISPHKLGSRPTSAADRLQMLRLATAGLPWAVVDDWEMLREGPSFSYRTAEAMVRAFPGCRLFWIMGTDQWNALDSWAEPGRLAACVEFVVFSREERPLERAGCRMHALEGGHPASATVIRDAVARGETDHPWLTPDVSRWIHDHRLYQNTQ
jgi:nicotinate-nucleotide adenylyltransferase